MYISHDPTIEEIKSAIIEIGKWMYDKALWPPTTEISA
jgi:hypothetical protein